MESDDEDDDAEDDNNYDEDDGHFLHLDRHYWVVMLSKYSVQSFDLRILTSTELASAASRTRGSAICSASEVVVVASVPDADAGRRTRTITCLSCSC